MQGMFYSETIMPHARGAKPSFSQLLPSSWHSPRRGSPARPFPALMIFLSGAAMGSSLRNCLTIFIVFAETQLSSPY